MADAFPDHWPKLCRGMMLAAAVVLSSTQLAGAQIAAGNAGDDPTVAIVGNQPIRESYVQRSIRELKLGDQIDVRSSQSDFLDSIIREEVLFQYSLKNMMQDPQWRDTLKALVVQKLLEVRIRDKSVVSDQEARTYYLASRQNLGGEHINLYDIRFVDRKTCETQFEAIRSLADFKRIAAEFHVDPELAQAGGEIGFLMTRHIAFGYGPQIEGLAENTPHRIMNGVECHIVWFNDREILPVPTFEELRGRLKAGLQAGAEADLLQVLLREAEGSVGVTRLDQKDDVVDRTQTTQPAGIGATKFTFNLVNHRGEPVDQTLFDNRRHVIMFGFTHCPEVCPTTLFEMSHWQQQLGERAKDIQFAFVSIDPERDTPQIIAGYVNAFSQTIIGLTGSPEEISKLVSRFGVKVQRVALEDDDYTMDHTSSIFLVDQNGELQDTIAFMEGADSAISKLQNLLGITETDGLNTASSPQN